MKKILLLTLILISTTSFSQLKKKHKNKTFNTELESSIINTFEFWYDVTNPEINLAQYLKEKNFELSDYQNIKVPDADYEVWVLNSDTLKRVHVAYVDCSETTRKNLEVRNYIFNNWVGKFTPTYTYTLKRNERSFWLVKANDYQVLTLIVPYGDLVYEKNR